MTIKIDFRDDRKPFAAPVPFSSKAASAALIEAGALMDRDLEVRVRYMDWQSGAPIFGKCVPLTSKDDNLTRVRVLVYLKPPTATLYSTAALVRINKNLLHELHHAVTFQFYGFWAVAMDGLCEEARTFSKTTDAKVAIP